MGKDVAVEHRRHPLRKCWNLGVLCMRQPHQHFEEFRKDKLSISSVIASWINCW